MLDYQRIADDVRNSLSVQGTEDADYLRAIVADFAVACEEVNERLQQCEALLRRGLRSEALHLCEIEPNLLDAAAALDLPEREQWEEFIGQFGLVPPLPVNVEAAAALSEAYAAEQPMTKLLRNHRLLALARGPLSERITTLRRLADADPANPIWPEDVEAFERVRVEHIFGEATAARERGDLDALKRLCEEVCDPSWRSPPAERVVESVLRMRDNVLHAGVHRQLEAKQRALAGAFDASDLKWGRRLRAEWNELLATPSFAPDPEVYRRAAPALRWLDEQDQIEEQQRRHASAVAALEQALTRHYPLARLQQRYRAATGNGEVLPCGLEERYRKRVELLRRAATRRRCIAALAAAGALLLLAGGAWGAARWRAKQSRFEQTRQNLEDLIDRGDLEAAEAYRIRIEGEEPDALRWPPIAVLVARLESALGEEEQRRDRFRTAAAEVDDLLGAARELTGKAGTWQDFAECQEAVVAAESALNEAQRWAGTDEDKARVEALARRVEAGRKQLRDKELAKLREHFDSLGDDVKRLGAAPDAGKIERAQGTLRELADKVRELEVPGLYRRRIERYEQDLETLRESLATLQREAPYLDAVTQAVGNPAGYHAALSAHAAEFAPASRASDFRRVAEDRAIWEAVAAFNALVERWNDEVPALLTPENAKEYLEAVGNILEGSAGNLDGTPYGEALRERVPLLEAVANRGAGRGRAALERELNQPIMRACWCVEDRASGRRYYVLEEPTLRPGPTPIQYVVNRAGRQQGGMVHGHHAEVAVAPQVALSEALRPMLAELDHQNWESTWYAIMEAIYRADAVDALLRFDLLRMALSAARNGSYPMEKAFEAQSEAFSGSEVNLFANWMDPTCSEAGKARQRAHAELNRMPSFAAARNRAKELLEALHQPPGSPYQWLGWLRRNSQDRWAPVVGVPSRGAGEVFVFCTEGNDVQSFRIGTFQRGEVVVDSAAEASLREGTPLFVTGSVQGQP